MNNSQIMSIYNACQSFPILGEPQISRENVVNTIGTSLEGSTEVLFVEGGPGTGKTTVLAQFAVANPLSAISVFSRPTSKWAYDPRVLQLDLCNQMQWILTGHEISDIEKVDDSFFRTRILSLSRQAVQKRKKYYFVVDGLEEIPDNDIAIRQAIFQMLPFGFPAFRYLISGDAELYKSELHDSIKQKNFPLTGFTLDETQKYLGDLGITSRDVVEEIHQICRGIPGHLASVRRILEKGVDPKRLVADMPSQLPDLFEIEWRELDNDNPQYTLVLAILAHDGRAYTAEDLALFVELSREDIETFLEQVTFVEIDPNTGVIAFVSETFRSFAAEKLNNQRDAVHDLLIDELLKQPDSQTSLTYLPSYYAEAGKDNELIAYLDQENLTRMLHKGQSLVAIRQRLLLGLSASERVGRSDELVRFSLKSSSLRVVSNVEVWRSEVKALMALGNFDAALALAQGMVPIEDRLHLLAVIAKEKHDRCLTIEEELDAQIRQICQTVDATELGEKAIDIATDLIQSHADLAIQLVEASTRSSDDENAMDWAMARLSIHTLGDKQANGRPVDAVEQIRQRIQDPKARSFSATASLLLGNYSAAEAIDEVKKFDKASDQLYLLRIWSVENREAENAWMVSDYGLKLVLQTPDYAPNARVLRELATPIPHIKELSTLQKLTGKFDAQKLAIEKAGPTEDYVRLELILARAEMKVNRESASNRLVELYDYVCAIKDLVTRASCLARMVSTLRKIDPDRLFDHDTGIHTFTQKDLEEMVDNLLRSTASHFEATRGVIRALARAEPMLAMEITNILNTETRRDKARLEFIGSAIQGPVDEIALEDVLKAVDDVCSGDLKDEAILKCLARLSFIDDTNDGLLEQVIPLLNRIKYMSSAYMKCNACTMAFSLLEKRGGSKYASLSQNVLDILQESWNAIDPGYARIDVGFAIVEDLAPVSSDLATEYMRKTDEFRQGVVIDSAGTATAYDHLMKLMSRTLGGLIRAGIDTERDIKIYGRFLEEFQSCGHRASHWGDLALHFYLSNRVETCKTIVSSNLKPLLENISEQDQEYRSRVVAQVAPALYCAHQRTALNIISKLPTDRQDAAYRSICTFILRKCLPSEPYDSVSGESYDITYEDISDIVNVLHNMREDSLVYYFIVQISLSVQNRKRDQKFSREQVHDIAKELENLVKTKFPSKDFIQHDGYKIIGLAQVARISSSQAPNWQQLRSRADDIDNVSDRAFILAEIASAMPGRLRNERLRLIEEAEGLIAQIPSANERISRYRGLAGEISRFDMPLSRKYLRAAIDMTKDSEAPNMYSIQKELIDTAHRLDPEFAASLVSLLDEDRATKRLQRHLGTLNFRQEAMNQRQKSSDFVEHSALEYVDVAWMLLGSINAKRFVPVHMSNLLGFIRVAAELPLERSYPIYALVIENAVRRWSKSTEESALNLRPFLDSLIEGSRFALNFGARSSDLLQRAKLRETKSRSSTDASIQIGDGERDKAIEFIRKWLEASARDYIKISDPYIGPEDLDILKLLLHVRPSIRVSILTSMAHQKKEKIQEPWRQAYSDYWRIVSVQKPPDTEIAIVGVGARGSLPIHDRWWLTDGGGLRVGTSYHSLGVRRTSEISIMTEEEARSAEAEVDKYLTRSKREHIGEKVLYEFFNL